MNFVLIENVAVDIYDESKCYYNMHKNWRLAEVNISCGCLNLTINYNGRRYFVGVYIFYTTTHLKSHLSRFWHCRPPTQHLCYFLRSEGGVTIKGLLIGPASPTCRPLVTWFDAGNTRACDRVTRRKGHHRRTRQGPLTTGVTTGRFRNGWV